MQGSKLPDAKTLNASVFFILCLKIDMWTTKNACAYFSKCTKIVPFYLCPVPKCVFSVFNTCQFSDTIWKKQTHLASLHPVISSPAFSHIRRFSNTQYIPCINKTIKKIIYYHRISKIIEYFVWSRTCVF
jgi:hypothetical protein